MKKVVVYIALILFMNLSVMWANYGDLTVDKDPSIAKK